jgi:hypothetical protein
MPQSLVQQLKRPLIDTSLNNYCVTVTITNENFNTLLVGMVPAVVFP